MQHMLINLYYNLHYSFFYDNMSNCEKLTKIQTFAWELTGKEVAMPEASYKMAVLARNDQYIEMSLNE